MIGALARLVKVEHSVFALPFAYIACRGRPGLAGWRLSCCCLWPMVAMRSFAMAVNRLADLPYDRVNPRTNRRELVTGEVGVARPWSLRWPVPWCSWPRVGAQPAVPAARARALVWGRFTV
jgi:4-hydroxybenzoate polyprenyltransferase